MNKAVTRKDVQTYTAKRISSILNASDPAMQKAALATLRRGVGHAPGELPQLWGEYLLDMPEEMYGINGQASREEWAIYIALTLFALHQQGHDPSVEPMYREGQSIGYAVGCLATNEVELNRILRRLNAAATANTTAALAHYLRGLIQLLRSESIPLDYVSLAGDIFQFQNPDSVGRIRLAWGQDFYRSYYKNKKQEDDKS